MEGLLPLKGYPFISKFTLFSSNRTLWFFMTILAQNLLLTKIISDYQHRPFLPRTLKQENITYTPNILDEGSIL